MPTNQKYSQRIHTKRQLSSAVTHLKAANGLISDVGLRYEEALPRVQQAAIEMIKLLCMLESMIDDIKDNI